MDVQLNAKSTCFSDWCVCQQSCAKKARHSIMIDCASIRSHVMSQSKSISNKWFVIKTQDKNDFNKNQSMTTCLVLKWDNSVLESRSVQTITFCYLLFVILIVSLWRGILLATSLSYVPFLSPHVTEQLKCSMFKLLHWRCPQSKGDWMHMKTLTTDPQSFKNSSSEPWHNSQLLYDCH